MVNKLLSMRRYMIATPLIILGVICIGGGAAYCESKSAPQSFSFAVHSGVWQEYAGGKSWGHVASASVEAGEPVFLQVSLVNSGATAKVGLDGAGLAGSSLEVLVTTDLDFRLPEWDPPHGSPEAAAEPDVPASWLVVPSNDDRDGGAVVNYKSVSIVIWLIEDDSELEDEQSDASLRLAFNEPGLHMIWTRLPRLFLPYGPRAMPIWRWYRGTGAAGVDVAVPDPEVKSFATDVAKVISVDLIVPPAGRPMLEAYAKRKERVGDWAQWLLLRSHTGDPKWRKAILKRDENALEVFRKLRPLAQRFVDEPKRMRTPPWYDAKLFLAAEFASREPELAEAGVAEVLESYAGARAVWEVGREDNEAEERPKRPSLTIKLLDREKHEGGDKN